ncbi:MAG: DsbA family protein [Vicinamibacterales bacterium]
MRILRKQAGSGLFWLLVAFAHPAGAGTEGPLSLAHAAGKGPTTAKVAIVEFSDFECPFCGRYTRETLARILDEYVTPGRIRYVFRHFPLERIHPRAFKAALSAECARQQGKFWDMHDRLFANQRSFGDLQLLAHAGAVGMDQAAFKRCVMAPGTTARVRQDLRDGVRAGVTGTPTFLIGFVQQDGRLKIENKVSGAEPYASLKAVIDGVLALAGTTR